MSNFKMLAGTHTAADVDAAPAIREWTPQFPADYQSGGDRAGLRTDRGIWTAPALPHTAFLEAEAFAETGDRGLRPLGAPMAIWFFPYLSKEQLAYLRTNFCPSPARAATVTIRTQHEDGTWGTYVGALHWPAAGQDMEPAQGGWRDVTFHIKGLRQAEAGT